MIIILPGLTVKPAGRASIWSSDIDAAPRKACAAIGVVPQELNIDPFFTPRETLELQAGLFGVPPSERRTAENLDLIDLTDKAGAYARTLSGGMRRRRRAGWTRRFFCCWAPGMRLSRGRPSAKCWSICRGGRGSSGASIPTATTCFCASSPARG